MHLKRGYWLRVTGRFFATHIVNRTSRVPAHAHWCTGYVCVCRCVWGNLDRYMANDGSGANEWKWHPNTTLRAKQFIRLTWCTEHYAVLHTLCEAKLCIKCQDQSICLNITYLSCSWRRRRLLLCVRSSERVNARANSAIQQVINFKWQSIHCITMVSHH